MKLGTNDIGSVYLGTNAVQKVYLGTNEVWSAVDPDAQAFFDRVTTAGGSLSTTEQTAVNTLVTQMKTDGIWTKMKAIYPMVGASAAACAQNLKSSSFTGTFTSGWTFASTGIKGNGTSTSFNTTINPSIDLSQNNVHISIYIRTNNTQNGVDIGTANLSIQFYGGTLYYAVNISGFITFANEPSNKFALASRISSIEQKLYLNNTLKSTNSNTSVSLNNQALPIGSWYGGAYPTNREYAFASIGDGLTDTEASDFYTAIQAFQTTLSRNV